MTRAYIGGTFDLLHAGHIETLRCAKEMFGYVIVSANTDEFAARYKRRPVLSLAERMEMLRACRYVDEVVVNHGNEDSRPAILESGATHVVHGDDWMGESLMRQMGMTQEWLDEHGIQFAYFPLREGISSSEIRRRCTDLMS